MPLLPGEALVGGGDYTCCLEALSLGGCARGTMCMKQLQAEGLEEGALSCSLHCT